MNKNVKNVPKIIQNTSKRLNHCISNGLASLSDCFFLYFQFCFLLINRGVLCIFIYHSVCLCPFVWVSCIILHISCIICHFFVRSDFYYGFCALPQSFWAFLFNCHNVLPFTISFCLFAHYFLLNEHSIFPGLTIFRP